MFKKFLSFALVTVMVFGISTTSFAAASTSLEEDTFSIDNYTQYTFDLNHTQSLKTRGLKTESNEQKIDAVVSYVESLNLGDRGYSNIEEACLLELEGYKNDGVELEKYTVLVPKTRSMHYYGTYSGNDFYYEYTSVSDFRRETIGKKKSSSNADSWERWILGLADLGMCFGNLEWSIPYSIIRTVTGVDGTSAVHNKSYNEYVEQFTDVVTRTIYKERSSNNYDDCYQDQTASLRVKLYFCPVGTAFDSDYIKIGDIFDDSVSANDLSKSKILKLANTYSNKNSEIIYKVSNNRIQEIWE